MGHHDLAIALRVLERDPRLIGERHQEIQVLAVVGITGELGPERNRADERALGEQRQHHRCDHQVVGDATHVPAPVRRHDRCL